MSGLKTVCSLMLTLLTAVAHAQNPTPAKPNSTQTPPKQSLTPSKPIVKSLTPLEQEALSRWGKRSGIGTLLNPPIGKTDQQIQDIENMVREIVETLRPGLLKEKQIFIGVHSDSAPNAFMERLNVDGFRFVPRRFLGFDTKKPIYQLGVTLGLFNLLETKEQVAGVIAHELIHLLEKHVDDPNHEHKPGKSWYSSQRIEGVTDYMALELLMGHYNLDGLLEAIWKISEYQVAHLSESEKNSEFSQLVEAVMTGLTSHHDRGVRISLIQARIEALRSLHFKAQSKKDRHDLPAPLRRLRNPRKNIKGTPQSPEVMEQLLKIQLKIVERVVMGKNKVEGSSLYLTLSHPVNKDLNTLQTRRLLRRFPTHPEFLALIEKLIESVVKNPEWTREQKITGLWALLDLNARHVAFYPMTPTEYVRIFAAAALPVLGQQSLNWTQFIHSKEFNPHGLIDDRMVLMLSNSPAGQDLFSLLFENIVYSDHKNSDGWLKDGEPRKLNYQSLSRLTVNHPFENMKKFETERQDFREFAQRLILRELDKHVTFLDQPEFRNRLFTSNDSESDLRDFLFFTKSIQEPDHLLFQKTRFVQRLLSMREEVVTWGQQKQTQVLKRIGASESLISREQILELNEVLELAYYLPLTQEQEELLKSQLFRVVKAVLTLPDPLFLSYAGQLLDRFVRSESVPLGSREINKMLLQILSDNGIPHQQVERERLTRLVERLASGIGSEGLRQIILNPPSDVFEQRFLRELQSPTYSENKSKLLTARESLNSSNSSIMQQISFDMDLFPLENYFTLHAKYSEDEFASKIGLLSLLDLDGLREKFNSNFTLTDIDQILRDYHLLKFKAERRKKQFELPRSEKPDNKDSVDMGALMSQSANLMEKLDMTKPASFLLSVLALRQNEVSDFKTWIKKLRSILNVSSAALESRPELKDQIEQRFLELSSNGQDPQAYLYLRSRDLKSALSERVFIPVLFEEFKRRLGERRSSTDLNVEFDKMDLEFSLKRDFPDVYKTLREEISEKLKLQPSTIHAVFPDSETKVNTKNTEGLDGEMRGFSALVNLSRSRSLAEQMVLIEYLMGREKEIPGFILEKQKSTSMPLATALYNMKIRLARESELARTFVVNSLVTGPDGFAMRPGSEDLLIEKYFKDSSNKSMATEITKALFRSLGKDRSLAIAAIMAQKGNGDGVMDEGELLKGFLESAFGVPGKKLAQYLAFVGEMGALREALASTQDSASPLSYLEVLKLINTQMGLSFSEKYEIVRALGSGSVNVAIEIIEKASQKTLVASVLREAIQVSSKKDFDRLSQFAMELSRVSEERYGFLPGLLKIIEASVNLEFDKKNSYERQKAAEKIYAQSVDGWTLKAPAIYEHTDLATIMEKAQGKTAVKIRKADFKTYKEVMTQVLRVEFDHLLNSQLFYSYAHLAFANPDMHDGQVIIDVQNKVIQILDFGQAVAINKEQRDLGLMILRLLSETRSPEAFAKEVQKISTVMGGKPLLSAFDLNRIYSKSEMMDRFVYFLGAAENKGWSIPIATVHFVLGMNRLVKLGDVIGLDMTRRIKTLLTAREFTKSTELSYYVEKMVRKYEALKAVTCRKAVSQ